MSPVRFSLWCFLASMTPSRDPLWRIESLIVSVLRLLFEELNKEELDYENVMWILFYYSLILFLSAVFAFFERYFLGTFAGLFFFYC